VTLLPLPHATYFIPGKALRKKELKKADVPSSYERALCTDVTSTVEQDRETKEPRLRPSQEGYLWCAR
jgi:hypothetical protein